MNGFAHESITEKNKKRFSGGDEQRDKNVSMDFVRNSCEQTTKELLKLAHTFARKSRRPSTQLTCTDLVNAFDCMNIMYKKRSIHERDMLKIEYK